MKTKAGKKAVKKEVAEEVPSKVKVGEVDMDALRTQVIKSSVGGGTRTPWLKIEDNTSITIRILPPLNGLKFPWHEHISHPKGDYPFSSWTYKQEGGRLREILLTCLDAMFKKPCPVCELIAWADEEGDSAASKMARKAKYNVNIINRDAEEVQLASFTPFIAAKIQTYMNTPKIGNITHPEKGSDLVYSRTGPKPVRYDIQIADRCPIDYPKWETKAADLTKVYTVLEYEEMCKVMNDNIGTEYDLEDILGIKVAKTEKKGRKK